MLGIPTIYDRVCQQALLNRGKPIFEPVFDDASFGYRRGRSTKDAMRKVWKEIDGGREWIVDGDLKDFISMVHRLHTKCRLTWERVALDRCFPAFSIALIRRSTRPSANRWATSVRSFSWSTEP